MSVRRFVNTKIWADAWIESLDPIEKLVWLYLLTNDYTNMLGIYQVSMKRIIFETGLTKTQIIKALKGFESVRKAFYWFDEWIFLPNWIKNQSMNPNMLRSATENFKVLPKHLIDKLKENGFEGFESLSNGLPTLRNIEVEDEVEIEDEGEKPSVKNKIGFKHNVKLTQKEYDTFLKDFGETAIKWMIEKLSAYKEAKGKTYKSDAGAIRSWVIDEWEKKHKQPDKDAEAEYLKKITVQ